VTALTSVIRDVLQQKEPKKLEELKKEALVRKDLLTDEPIKQSNVINIEVPETVAKLVQEAESRTDKRTRKLRGLIVGVGGEDNEGANADVNSATLFENVLKNTFADHGFDLRSITGSYVTKEAILEEWRKVVSTSKENDDLLFYIAANARDVDGHCCVLCSDAGSSSDAVSSSGASALLRDEEIGAITKTGHYASLTMVLQLDHAATTHWIDPSNPKNIVFASSKYEQRATWFTIHEEGGPYCALTYVLVESIRAHGMHVSNRDLFIDALKRYEDLPWDMNEAGHHWQYKAPQLIGSPEAYDRIFLQGKNYTAALQSLLRQAGYFDGKTTGHWEQETALALESYCTTTSLSTRLSKSEYIQHLKDLIEERRGVQKPLFLLVFADPQQLFPGMKDERRAILETLRNTESKIELLVLDDPDMEAIHHQFKDKANRDRIQLFYYSGGDDQGDMVLKDGVLHLFEFAPLLHYQPHLKALISNTCRSQYFADYATQLGVGIAYGITGPISTAVCEEFGELIFNRIHESNNLLTFPDYLNNKRSRTNEHFNAIQLYTAKWYQTESILSWDLGLVDVHDTELVNKEEVYAIIIGIGAYRDSSLLKGAEEDANHFLSWLIGEGVPEYNIKILIPTSAILTQDTIDDAIVSIIDHISENRELPGRLIFYVTGKGVADADHVTLCLPGFSSLSRNEAINLNAYFSALSAVQHFKEILFFYDLEEMGQFGIQGLFPTFSYPAEPKSGTFSSYMMGQLFSNSFNVRMEGWQRGHFTQMLIQGLNGAAADQEGKVTARSLRLYMINALPNMRATHSGERDFEIAVNKPKPSPQFINQWALVVGSNNYQLPEPVFFISEKIGKLLAHNGFGLISGGWPGVDHVVARSFDHEMRIYGLDVNDYLTQIVYEDRGPDYNKGKIIKVSSYAHWHSIALQQATVVILIGGQQYTYETYQHAIASSIPVIPIPATGESSRAAFAELIKSDRNPIPLTLLKALDIDPITPDNINELSQSVHELLEFIKQGQLSKETPSMPEEEMSIFDPVYTNNTVEEKMFYGFEMTEAIGGEPVGYDDPEEHFGPFVTTRGRHQLVLPAAFKMGKYLITNEFYYEFIMDGGYENNSYWIVDRRARKKFVCQDEETFGPASWLSSKEYPYLKASHPVSGVSYYEAQAFCNWLQQKYPPEDGWEWRLPTEDMWEFAARSKDGLWYPWGFDFIGGYCNSAENNLNTTSSVFDFQNGKSRYGCLDMAGNVWEYVRAQDENHSWCVMRGGSFKNNRYEIRSHLRLSNVPWKLRALDFGFRCGQVRGQS
jgi:formylglycine-generating enzyme required for sulfatase activity